MEKILNESVAVEQKNERTEFLELLDSFFCALSEQKNSVVLEKSEDYKKLLSEYENLKAEISSLSDEVFMQKKADIEAEAVKLIEILQEPYETVKEKIFDLIEMAAKHIKNTGNLNDYNIIKMPHGVELQIDEKQEPLKRFDKKQINSTESSSTEFSKLRQYTRTYIAHEKDFTYAEKTYHELIAKGFSRAKLGLIHTYNSKSIDEYWDKTCSLIEECINDNHINALYELLVMDKHVRNTWTSWKNAESILKIMAYGEGRKCNREYAIALLSKLYAFGYVNDWIINISGETDYEKALHYASFILENSKNTRYRNDAHGVLLRILSSEILGQDKVFILQNKLKSAQDMILKIMNETSSSEKFSNIYGSIPYDLRPHFSSFLETIISDESMPSAMKNKARYTLAKEIERHDPKRTKELLLSAAYDGCHSSQNIIISYAKNKPEEADLLSTIERMIAER